MATHAVVNFTLDSLCRGVEYRSCLINFSFRAIVLRKTRYLFVFVLRNDRLKIGRL